ncbi:MAG: MBL fold metallo-hydrolase [Gemmatimonadota bacterium]|nr:MAG: MBL fold metallo-hydrolase [Gemmatimonadota bacterium]
MIRSLLLVCTLSLLFAPSTLAQADIPINSKWLSDRVLVTWACNHFQGTNMAVVVTEQGLVIIDTGLSPSTVRRQRELIESELGRSDFRYIINTHMHNDHAFANEVFPDATVIAHQNSVVALEREVESIPELLERVRSSRERYVAWAAETSPDSTSGIHAREGVAAFDVGIADLEAGIEPRYPTVTFERHHTLRLGDVRLELFDFTSFHSDSDLLILIPEERMLFTGDVFWGGQLPFLREETLDRFPQVLDTWKTILEESPDLTTVVPGHSDVPLAVEDFRGMYHYLSRLWADVTAAREADTPLVRFLMQNTFKERYPEVADYSYIRREYNLHQHNIYMLWQLAGG